MKNVYLAASVTVPKVGEVFRCYRIEFNSLTGPELVPVRTSPVTDVIVEEDGLLRVETLNSIYVVHVK